jgi:hypothetical protein
MPIDSLASRSSVADVDAAGTELTPKVLARRRSQRRHMLFAAALSYLFDVGLFSVYALNGTTTFATPIVYGISGITVTLVFLVLSESGFNDRFSDHYLTSEQNVCSLTIMLGGVYLAPEVGFAFCCLMFIVVGFSTMRMTARQAGFIWTYLTIGLTVVFLLTDKPVAMPSGSWADRVVTLLFLVTVLGRCMSQGLFAV